MSSAICFNLDQSEILSSGNALKLNISPPCECDDTCIYDGNRICMDFKASETCRLGICMMFIAFEINVALDLKHHMCSNFRPWVEN